MDEITISRPLAPDEALKRLVVARRTMLPAILIPVLGGGAALLVLLIGLVTQWSIGWMLGAAALFALLVGGAVALGLTVGTETMRRQSRYELGASGVLTAVWGGSGGRVTAENLQRSFGYHEIRWIREVDGYVVLRSAMQWHPSHYLLALPPDFVPDAVRQHLAAAGVPRR